MLIPPWSAGLGCLLGSPCLIDSPSPLRSAAPPHPALGLSPPAVAAPLSPLLNTTTTPYPSLPGAQGCLIGSRGSVALLEALCAGKVAVQHLDLGRNGLDHQVRPRVLRSTHAVHSVR